MKSQLVITMAAWVLATQIVFADDQLAITTLEDAGASVQRDITQKARPVLQVNINLRQVTPAVLESLKEVEYLPSIAFLGSGDTEITPATLQALQGKDSLKRLAISFAKISDESARILGSMKGLDALELGSQIEISPRGKEEILKLTQLKELALADRLVNDDVMADLKDFRHLKVLSLRSIFITDAGISSLCQLNQLRKLRILLGSQITTAGVKELERLRIPELDVTLLNVNDENLKELRTFDGLKTLRLINAAKVTDAGIPYLSKLSELKELDINDAGVTKAGINQLKKAIPGCKVTFDARQRN